VSIEFDGEEVVYGLETTTGNYVVWGLASSNSGQYQQAPVPRKGGIFKREYWQCYVPASEGTKKGQFPEFDFVIVSVDSAYTEKEENDPTGCPTWGIWTDPDDGFPKIMLLAAWRKHLPLHGEDQPPQERGETDVEYAIRCMPYWGLVETVAWSCRRQQGVRWARQQGAIWAAGLLAATTLAPALSGPLANCWNAALREL
jgi:hypothetical protein